MDRKTPSRDAPRPDTVDFDVVVVGGGPAGATVGTLVAEAGYRTLLLERATGPEFKVGESLMPATYWSFRRLGILEKLRDSPFTRKASVQFYTRSGEPTAPFYFYENDPHESSRTWQVLRSEFDALLLANAEEKGVEVRRGWPVKRVLFSGERAVGVRVGERDISCRVVVDASGQSSLLGRKLGLKEVDPRLMNASIYSHFRGGYREPGIDGGATLVMSTRDQDSWFWYIPLPDDVVSVGVVAPLEYLVKSRSGDPQSIFEDELAKCPALGKRLKGAQQIREMAVAKDFTYRCRRIAGDGWVMAGDAYGFIDPTYSSGVFLALKSGEMAADSILDAFAHDDTSAARLGRHEGEYIAGMEAIRRLVYAFYDKDFSFSKFLKRYPECRMDVVNLLVGNVFREPVEALFGPLAEMSQQPEGLLAGDGS